MNVENEFIGEFSERRFIQLLIQGCAESLRIGALGDFCTILKYVVLFSWNKPSHQDFLSSRRRRRFCFSNDCFHLTIEGIRVPHLDPRFDGPGWTPYEFLCDVRLMLSSVLDNKPRETILERVRGVGVITTLEEVLLDSIIDLFHQDPERFSMLLTLVTMFLAAEDDENEAAGILEHEGLEFLFGESEVPPEDFPVPLSPCPPETMAFRDASEEEKSITEI